MLLRNKEEQEVSSMERKDRRDFEQLSALATRMGLHRYRVIIWCQLYLSGLFLNKSFFAAGNIQK